MHSTNTGSRTRTRGPAVVAGAVIAMTAALAAIGSCFFSSATNVCESGLRCAPGLVCSVAQDACIEIGGCGDGVVNSDKGEVCDDGNTRSGDGCSADCMSTEVCGNNILDTAAGELCDDGNTRDGDGCSSKCIPERCGNKILDPGEVCDDGNTISGDGCSADCTSNEACGNGIVDKDVHEECDPIDLFPLPARDTSTCNSDCTFAKCGDGHTNTQYLIIDSGPPHFEQCDSGVMGIRMDSPSCNQDCTVARCGDGYTNMAAGEMCDEGSGNSNLPDAACRKDCHKPTCGDGITDTGLGERCDDGNHDNTDACPDGPGGMCKPATCGDGFVWEGHEQCDDGNHDNTDACPDGPGGTCQPATCGDGFVWIGHEACDPPDGHPCNSQTGTCQAGCVCTPT
jgi:cysteine-rich repeat protein